VVVPFKGHEIEFTFKDSPGVRHELLWDELLVGPDALLLVLSPTTRKDKGEAEERFIRDQLMFVRAVVAGYLGSLKVGKKPRMVIIFVGKFDLFSRVQPEQAQGELDRLEAQFADHVQAVRMAAGAAIRVYDIYGSAVEGWGRVSVLEAVLHGLYEA
jgi:signal recognition particle receptor subunit beta